MGYRSILTVWDGKQTSWPSLNAAIKLTIEADGHLHVICPAFITKAAKGPYPFNELPKGLREDENERVLGLIEQSRNEINTQLEKQDIHFSTEPAIINRDQLATYMSHVARFSDLAILPKPFGSERTETDEKIAEGTLIAAECPVLIVPETEPREIPTKAVIAWDRSNHSLRAIRAALPLLRHAKSVDVVTVTDNKKDIVTEEVASELGVFLSRHRIKINVNILPKSMPKISDVIQAHARKLDANLVVMGGYGHSPLREFLFGGPTREMLQGCEVPILMAH